MVRFADLNESFCASGVARIAVRVVPFAERIERLLYLGRPGARCNTKGLVVVRQSIGAASCCCSNGAVVAGDGARQRAQDEWANGCRRHCA